MSTQDHDHDKDHDKGLMERLRAVGEAIENVFDPDDDKKEHHHPQPPPAPVHMACPPVTVNVNLCCPPGSKPCPGGTGTGTGGQPGRPTHSTGSSDGTVGIGLTGPGSIIQIPQRPPHIWPGPRGSLAVCPYLLIRGNAGDTGARPLAGVFWESPDIFILPGVAPALAPPVPPSLAGVADAGQDNTVYAHVWNLGQGAAIQALVEFYWFNPAMGFSEGHQNLIGFTRVDLGPRTSAYCHRVVKCPQSWKASYTNGGHECLVVRVSDSVKDPLSNPAWDASQNRHIGQRNIHVMTAAEAAAKPTLGIAVGPLFGQAAQLQVQRAQTTTMPWLHLVTNSRTLLPATGAATGDVGITAAMPLGANLPNLGAISNARAAGLIGDGTGATGDGQQVGFVTTDGNPGAGNAHVYRVSGSQNGQTFGGYTVVIVGG
jgi:hypothetical protein